MTDKRDYEKKLERQLNEWKDEIRRLNLKADKAQSNMKNEYMREIKTLKNKQQTFEQKLSQLQSAGEDSWKNLRQGLDRAWSDLGQAIKSAKTKLK